MCKDLQPCVSQYRSLSQYVSLFKYICDVYECEAFSLLCSSTSQARSQNAHSEHTAPSIPKEFQLDLDMIENDHTHVSDFPDLVQHKLDELLEPVMIPEPK